MCGIIISSLEIPLSSIKFVKNRGPDEMNIANHHDIHFMHFLLHLTGERTAQPVEIDGIVCIFNGEIYNYKELLPDAKSDIYSIIDCYQKHGEEFVKYLDGEFVIVLFDFNENKFIISADIFKTKPLFYKINEEIVMASYESSCKKIRDQKYEMIRPNETLVYDLENRTLLRKFKVHEFDLEQKKDSYDDFVKAFERAVLKRYPENSIPLITLSSGLDSGAIACCLKKYGKSALYVSIPRGENGDVINARHQSLGESHKIVDLTGEEKKKWRAYLEDQCEPFVWDWRYNNRVGVSINNGFDMGSMLGKSKIIDLSKRENSGIRVLFSGIGADEIMARNQFYSCGWGNVDYFPEDLSTVYPWANFFGGTMENYLKGDEYVGGSFGYETRYPYCDRELVQEFLWLKPHLKNAYKGEIYKAPLLYYLSKECFPFHLKKMGFNV